MRTLMENSETKVEVNSSGEVFVTNKQSGVTLRVSNSYSVTSVTTQNGFMTPGSVNGLSAFHVYSNNRLVKAP